MLTEVNVPGLHSGAPRAAAEGVASGGSRSAAVSLSLFLTTRLSQQMALTLTPKHREAADNRVGRCETDLCRPSRTFLFNQAQMVKYDQKQKGEEKDKYQPVGEWECGCAGN